MRTAAAKETGEEKVEEVNQLYCSVDYSDI